jgi:cell division transport system permease protein
VLALLSLHALLVPRLVASFALAGGLTLADTLPAPLLGGLVLGGAAVGLLGSALSVARALRQG